MDPQEFKTIAEEFLREQGLEDWTFRLDKGRNRFGNCNFPSRRISMARALIEANTLERCWDTLIHEVAHALAGPQAGHGPAWQRQARALGGTGRARFSSQDTRLVEGRWQYRCPKCGVTGSRHRWTKTTPHLVCASCSFPGMPMYLIWTDGKTGRVRLAPRSSSAA